MAADDLDAGAPLRHTVVADGDLVPPACAKVVLRPDGESLGIEKEAHPPNNGGGHGVHFAMCSRTAALP
jgi:hypothetical protein